MKNIESKITNKKRANNQPTDSNMHRKINISTCTLHILAYVIANAILSNAQSTTNETDQSIAVQTEKIINVHDVSQTTTNGATTTPSTVDFMNGQSTDNGNDNADDANDVTVMPTKSLDDGAALIIGMINAKYAERNNGSRTVVDRMKSFPQDFDFNLDDLEDFTYRNKDKLDGDDVVDVVTDNTSKFEEFMLEEVTPTNAARNKVATDNQRNVYRVAKGKSKPIADAFSRNNNGSSASEYKPWTNNGSVTSFQMFTEMYDQYRWNIDNIMTNVSNKCGLDMQIYLNALNGEVEWALKGNFFYSFLCFIVCLRPLPCKQKQIFSFSGSKQTKTDLHPLTNVSNDRHTKLRNEFYINPLDFHAKSKNLFPFQ